MPKNSRIWLYLSISITCIPLKKELKYSTFKNFTVPNTGDVHIMDLHIITESTSAINLYILYTYWVTLALAEKDSALGASFRCIICS